MKKKKRVPSALRKIIEKDMGRKFKKIEFAEDNKISLYQDEIALFFKALKVDAFVTDLSTLGDFGMAIDKHHGGSIKGLSKRFGIPLSRDDYIWEIGKKIREKTTEN